MCRGTRVPAAAAHPTSRSIPAEAPQDDTLVALCSMRESRDVQHGSSMAPAHRVHRGPTGRAYAGYLVDPIQHSACIANHCGVPYNCRSGATSIVSAPSACNPGSTDSSTCRLQRKDRRPPAIPWKAPRGGSPARGRTAAKNGSLQRLRRPPVLRRPDRRAEASSAGSVPHAIPVTTTLTVTSAFADSATGRGRSCFALPPKTQPARSRPGVQTEPPAPPAAPPAAALPSESAG